MKIDEASKVPTVSLAYLLCSGLPSLPGAGLTHPLSQQHDAWIVGSMNRGAAERPVQSQNGHRTAATIRDSRSDRSLDLVISVNCKSEDLLYCLPQANRLDHKPGVSRSFSQVKSTRLEGRCSLSVTRECVDAIETLSVVRMLFNKGYE